MTFLCAYTDISQLLTFTVWKTSIPGWPTSPFCPLSPGRPGAPFSPLLPLRPCTNEDKKSQRVNIGRICMRVVFWSAFQLTGSPLSPASPFLPRFPRLPGGPGGPGGPIQIRNKEKKNCFKYFVCLFFCKVLRKIKLMVFFFLITGKKWKLLKSLRGKNRLWQLLRPK